MIGYLDTSALVPLIINEPSSGRCQRFWQDADVVVSSRLLYVETASALAQAERHKRITRPQFRKATHALDFLWDEIDVIEIGDALSIEAASLAHKFALRGYDAVHCASALLINDEDFVVASGDRQLLEALHQSSVATFDTNV